MNNSGDFVTIYDINNVSILTFDIEPLSNNPNESYSRNPDITGEFEQHAQILNHQELCFHLELRLMELTLINHE